MTARRAPGPQGSESTSQRLVPCGSEPQSTLRPSWTPIPPSSASSALRGPETVGELKQRAERLHHFDSAAEIEETLRALVARELATPLERRPGQKEGRWTQLLGSGDAPAAAAAPRPSAATLEERVRRLELDVAELRELLRPSP